MFNSEDAFYHVHPGWLATLFIIASCVKIWIWKEWGNMKLLKMLHNEIEKVMLTHCWQLVQLFLQIIWIFFSCHLKYCNFIMLQTFMKLKLISCKLNLKLTSKQIFESSSCWQQKPSPLLCFIIPNRICFLMTWPWIFYRFFHPQLVLQKDLWNFSKSNATGELFISFSWNELCCELSIILFIRFDF